MDGSHPYGERNVYETGIPSEWKSLTRDIFQSRLQLTQGTNSTYTVERGSPGHNGMNTLVKPYLSEFKTKISERMKYGGYISASNNLSPSEWFRLRLPTFFPSFGGYQENGTHYKQENFIQHFYGGELDPKGEGLFRLRFLIYITKANDLLHSVENSSPCFPSETIGIDENLPILIVSMAQWNGASIKVDTPSIFNTFSKNNIRSTNIFYARMELSIYGVCDIEALDKVIYRFVELFGGGSKGV